MASEGGFGVAGNGEEGGYISVQRKGIRRVMASRKVSCFRQTSLPLRVQSAPDRRGNWFGRPLAQGRYRPRMRRAGCREHAIGV